MPLTDNPIIRALSIRQPYAEQILRGTKRLEYRSTNSNIRERVWIYASLTDANDPSEWRKMGTPPGGLTNGKIIGSVVITDSIEQDDGGYAWKLADPKRLNEPLEVTNHPQPGIWRPVLKDTTVASRAFATPAEPFAKLGRTAKTTRSGSSSKAAPITGELICYHNPETMGAEAWEIYDQPFSAISSREYAGARGKRIWFVTGRGTPRRYYLAGWFTVDTVDTHPEADVEPGVFCYAGARGKLARRMTGMVEITKLPWLPALRKACANFATMQHVRDQSLLAALRATWDGKK